GPSSNIEGISNFRTSSASLSEVRGFFPSNLNLCGVKMSTFNPPSCQISIITAARDQSVIPLSCQMSIITAVGKSINNPPSSQISYGAVLGREHSDTYTLRIKFWMLLRAADRYMHIMVVEAL